MWMTKLQVNVEVKWRHKAYEKSKNHKSWHYVCSNCRLNLRHWFTAISTN